MLLSIKVRALQVLSEFQPQISMELIRQRPIRNLNPDFIQEATLSIMKMGKRLIKLMVQAKKVAILILQLKPDRYESPKIISLLIMVRSMAKANLAFKIPTSDHPLNSITVYLTQ